jgi:O-antigen/teichoic acid export membrane protein
MNRRRSGAAARTLLSASVFVLAGMQPAYAYIDPGTGSMIVQILAAAVAGSLFYVRRWRHFLTNWFLRRKSIPENTDRANEKEAN